MPRILTREQAAIKAKAILAAEALYPRMEEIDGRAMQAGQVEQSSDAEKAEWTRLVASIIRDAFESRS